MSAHMVNDQVIRTIVEAGIKYNVVPRKAASMFGQALIQDNARAMTARYGDPFTPDIGLGYVHERFPRRMRRVPMHSALTEYIGETGEAWLDYEDIEVVVEDEANEAAASEQPVADDVDQERTSEAEANAEEGDTEATAVAVENPVPAGWSVTRDLVLKIRQRNLRRLFEANPDFDPIADLDQVTEEDDVMVPVPAPRPVTPPPAPGAEDVDPEDEWDDDEDWED